MRGPAVTWTFRFEFYGTAWKEDRTQDLTELALARGFRGIDTANQRRHYDEAAVGRAIAASIAKGSLLEKGTGTTTDSSLMRGAMYNLLWSQSPFSAVTRGVVAREDLFLQTKFAFRRGQDHRLPYDPQAAIPAQVEQSFASSLAHLGVEQVDSYLLHGPTSSMGLSANRETLAAGQLDQIAARHRRTIPQIVFRFAIQIGMIPLTGTTDSGHMQADQEVFDFRLEPAEIAWIEDWDVR